MFDETCHLSKETANIFDPETVREDRPETAESRPEGARSGFGHEIFPGHLSGVAGVYRLATDR